MKLLDHQLDEVSLVRFGEEACQLLIGREFSELAARFGYALRGNCDEASAIEIDLRRCLPDRGVLKSEVVSVTVRSFKPNDIGLISLIECTLLYDKSVRVLVELIVAKSAQSHNLFLEEISGMA